MPRITNKGKKVRMVADEILQPGDSKYVTATKAREYKDDPDLVIDEVGPWKAEVQKAEEPVQETLPSVPVKKSRRQKGKRQ